MEHRGGQNNGDAPSSWLRGRNPRQADAQAAVAAEGILREWWTRQRA
jgi:hypothetical protein